MGRSGRGPSVQGAEVTGKAVRRTSIGPAAGYDGDCCSSFDSGPRLDGSIGEIDVFTGGKRLPAADGQVGASSNAEIRSVDVRVPVTKVVAIEPCLSYCEWEPVARPDGAEDEVDALVGVGDHLGEPVGGYP